MPVTTRLILRLLAPALLLLLVSTGRAAETELPTARVLLAGQPFLVEVAHTQPQRTQGLMYREQLGADRGMLFLFPRSRRYAFWMKNTLIPLDILFLDRDFRVVRIHHNALPCERAPCRHYPSGEWASNVIELNAGTARRLGVSDGSRLRFVDPASLPAAE